MKFIMKNTPSNIFYQCLLGLFILCTGISSSYAQQPPKISWQKCYGGTKGEGIEQIIRTSDGGFAFVGGTASNDGDLSGIFKPTDTNSFWFVKLNSFGVIEWQRFIDNKRFGWHNLRLIQTYDGGYAITGGGDTIIRLTIDTSRVRSVSISWLLKLDSSGKNMEWQHFFSGGEFLQNGGVRIFSMIQSNDSGIVVAGSGGFGGEGSNYHNSGDAYVAKFDMTGGLLWQRCYGGYQEVIDPRFANTGKDEAVSIMQTNDGGYVFAGTTNSMNKGDARDLNNGDVYGLHHSDSGYNTDDATDIWMVKLNAQGLIERQKCIGGVHSEDIISMVKTTDGGFVFVGGAASHDGDLSGVNTIDDQDSLNAFKGYWQVSNGIWVAKIDSTFNIEWQHRFGGTGRDFGGSIIQTLDGGYAFTANTNSLDHDVTGIHVSVILRDHTDSTYDIWVAKLSRSGSLEWQKCLGGKSDEYVNYFSGDNSIIQTPDSGYVIAGFTASNDGDVSGNHGGGDAWVVKLGGAINSVNNYTSSTHAPYQAFNIYPNPSNDVVQLELYYTQTAKKVLFYDMLGREYTPPYQLSENTATVNVKTLPPGAYVVKLEYSYNTYIGSYTLPLLVLH